jgi:hypothetical protein
MSKENFGRKNPDGEINPSQEEVDKQVKKILDDAFGEEDAKDFLIKESYKNLSIKDKLLVKKLKFQGWDFLGVFKSWLDEDNLKDEEIKIIGRGNYLLVFKKRKK